jgi:hypothetical protein
MRYDPRAFQFSQEASGRWLSSSGRYGPPAGEPTFGSSLDDGGPPTITWRVPADNYGLPRRRRRRRLKRGRPWLALLPIVPVLGMLGWIGMSVPGSSLHLSHLPHFPWQAPLAAAAAPVRSASAPSVVRETQRVVFTVTGTPGLGADIWSSSGQAAAFMPWRASASWHPGTAYSLSARIQGDGDIYASIWLRTVRYRSDHTRTVTRQLLATGEAHGLDQTASTQYITRG